MTEEVLESGGPGPDSPEETKNPPPSRGGRLPSVILAGALHLALLVTVGQAFLAGWVGRWWLLLGAVACFGFSAATFRKKPGWSAGAGALALGLTFLVPALLFGVDGAGLSIVMVPLPTVASGLLLLAFGFSGWVLWTLLSSLPVWARLIPGALALFAAVPVVMGLVEGLPFGEVLAGLWTLPYWTQGGWVGAAVLLPLGAVAAVGMLFIVHLRPARLSPKAMTALIAGLLMMALLTTTEMNARGLANALGFFGQKGTWNEAGGDSLADAGRPGDQGRISGRPEEEPTSATTREGKEWEALSEIPREIREVVGNALAQLAEESASTPDETFNVEAVQRRLGADPGILTGWVRDSTRWAPYEGVLRGTSGVLMERIGSSVDRALLLSELLSQAGHRNRLAVIGLPERVAEEIMRPTSLGGAWPIREGSGPPPPTAGDGGGSLQVSEEFARIAGSVAGFRNEMLSTLSERVIDQTADLTALLSREAPARDFLEASSSPPKSAQVASYWWVQVQDGGQWSDLHLAPVEAMGELEGRAPEETFSPGRLPDSVFHHVKVDVVIEQWSEQSGRQEHLVLSHSFRAVDLAGSVVSLTHLPLSDGGPAEPRSDQDPVDWYRTFLADQDAWVPSLRHKSTTIEGRGFRDSGEVIEDPNRPQSPGRGSGPSSPGGMFGGLSGGIAGGGGPDEESPGTETVLTAEWIDYEIESPRRPVRTIRRQVFDLVGERVRSSARPVIPGLTMDQRVDRAMALAGARHDLVQTGDITSEFAISSLAKGMLEEKDRLEEEIASLAASDTSLLDSSLLAALGRSPVLLYGFASTRREISPWRDVTFIAEPNVVSLVRRFRWTPAQSLAEALQIDVVSNEVEASTGNWKEDFKARLGQGVTDTNLEALLLSGYGPVENTALLHTASGRVGVKWKAVISESDPILENRQLSDENRARIRSSLAQGHILALPEGPVPTGTELAYGWWRVDPQSGTTLGMGSTGHGQGLVQRVVNQVFISGPGIGLMIHSHSCEQSGNTEGWCDPCVLAFGGFLTGLWSIGTGATANLMADKFLGAAVGAGVGSYSIITKLGKCLDSLLADTRGGYQGMGSI